MQQNNIAASLIVRRAGRQVSHHVGSDLLRAVMRIVPPIIGINLVPNGGVAHVLDDLERPHLVFGIGFLVNRIRRAEQDGAYAHAAGE